MSVASLEAQSLADAARREAERRATVAQPGKVYTDADLAGLSPRPGSAATAPASPAASTAQPSSAEPKTAEGQAVSEPADPEQGITDPSKAPKARVKRDEQHWRERAQVIRTRLNRVQSDVNALQARLSQLEANGGSPGDTQATTADLAKFEKELRNIQDEWTQFENRAKQAQVPTAWIR
jgi:hypothetical protein